MPLGSLGRFFVVALGGLTVIVAVIVVACFVGPGCWGFEYLIQRKKKNYLKEQVIVKMPSLKGNMIISQTCEPDPDFCTDYCSHVTHSTVSCGGTINHINENFENLKRTSLLTSQNLYPIIENSFPKMKVRISYSPLKCNEAMACLAVQVISASSLPCREYLPTLDSYVSLDVFKGKWSFQKSNKPVRNVQTRVIKNSLNPHFDQTFFFDGTKREIKEWCLQFTMFDNDRLTKVTPLCQKKVYVKHLKNLTTDGAVFMNLDMENSVKNMGTLLFGIRYLPTSQRFNVNIIKAEKLKYDSRVPSLLEFNPYIRIIMVNSNGKCIKKKKTAFKQGELNPIFNQSFVFDVSIANLEQTVLLILLCTKIMHQSQVSEDMSVDGGDVEASLKSNKDEVLGKIVLGRNVKCKNARNHWVTAMQNPRKMISAWHELR